MKEEEEEKTSSLEVHKCRILDTTWYEPEETIEKKKKKFVIK